MVFETVFSVLWASLLVLAVPVAICLSLLAITLIFGSILYFAFFLVDRFRNAGKKPYMSDYHDYTWIYDINRTAVTGSEFPCYHAYSPPGLVSVCGQAATTNYTTKMAGAMDCEACLAITGPDLDEDDAESEEDLCVFQSLSETESEAVLAQIRNLDQKVSDDRKI